MLKCARVASEITAESGSLEERLRRIECERDELRAALELRNCALDAAASHFMITESRQSGSRIVYVNVALARDHGYAPEDLVGADSSILAPEDLNPEQLERIAAATRAGESLQVEIRARRKDGSVFWAGVSLGPVRDATGKVTHYVSIGADITGRLAEAQNRRQLQEQLVSEMRERERMAIELRFAQKLEAVGQLAAGIAHEINTPIQYVGDSLTFLQQSAEDCRRLIEAYQASLCAPSADALETLKRIEAEVDLPFLQREVPKAFERTLAGIARVAEIVRAMKEFAHRDASEQSAADINHAIETTLTVARNEYKYLAEIETCLGDLPEVVCNVGELNQVLLNLIVNAAHAIEAAGKDVLQGRIRVSTAVSGPFIRITIEDNGCGIPEAHLERIFDPFFTTKEVGKGTGQGLAIARSIVVERHGGSIDVQSVVGVGTRFYVQLPIDGRPAESNQ